MSKKFDLAPGEKVALEIVDLKSKCQFCNRVYKFGSSEFGKLCKCRMK